ncbi:D-alanine--D-alanine ligase [Synergistales bacterium]|nr:D-alanine--D-alanine ligase [Synergistales bacterium]
MTISVGVFFGGASVEHEVSIISAMQAINNFDRIKYDVFPVYISKDWKMYIGNSLSEIRAYRDIPSLLKKSLRVTAVREKGRVLLMRYPIKKFRSNIVRTIDVAFPVGHGTSMEDGVLQGYLKSLSLPFVGCDVTASAVGMDKYITKVLLRDAGLPVLDCHKVPARSFFKDKAQVIKEILDKFKFPVVVKPLNLGSSVGISVGNDESELKDGLEGAFYYTNTALVEPAVQNLKEINCAVLGDSEFAMSSECEEPILSQDVLGYDDKYSGGAKDGGAKGMVSAKRKLPADITQEQRDKIRSFAGRAFQALGCCGVARVDFLLDGRSGEIWVNELNTIPGSLSFYLWEAVGMPYKELLDMIIELALKRERDETGVVHSFDTNILSNFSDTGAKGLKR